MRNRSTEIVASCQIVANPVYQEEYKLYYESLYYIRLNVLVYSV